MKKASNVLWGMILIAAGAVWALNAFDVIKFNIFFDGWWTLFIILPCAIGLFTEREKIGNLIGIAIGVVLLLCCQNILDFSILWKLLVPAVIIVIGLKLVFSGLLGSKAGKIIKKLRQEGKEPDINRAVFSGKEINYNGQVFEGAELTTVFGGVDCDLRKAIINKDCAIAVTAVFGGIDILVSDNVNVKVSANSIFGGVSNKIAARKDAPTIYISGTCIFGGVDIMQK